MNVQSRVVTGVEAEGIRIRSRATKIIQHILDQPWSKEKGLRRGLLAPLPPAAFHGLEPLGFGSKQDDNWWIFDPEECTPQVLWPLSVGNVTKHDNGEVSITMTRTISPRDVRGTASRFGPYMLRQDVAQMMNGMLHSASGLYVWLGGKWCDADPRSLWTGRNDMEAIPDRGYVLKDQDRYQPLMATAMALRQRYEWAVSIGLTGTPSVRFATDPTGIKELFRLREAPEGKDRREALLNWVCDHWRQKRSDPDVEVYVRKHMRGTTRFSWHSMLCEVVPSQFDVDAKERLLANRAAMKVAGADLRSREA